MPYALPSPNKGRTSAMSYSPTDTERVAAPCLFRGRFGGRFDGRLRLPALKEVDAAGVEQVGRDDKVEAAICSASLFDNAHAAREVGLALLRVDRDVSCDDDHGCAPFRCLRVSRHLLSRAHRRQERPKLMKGSLCEQLAWTRAQDEDASGSRSTELQRGLSAE
jgi:hypothetical protein